MDKLELQMSPKVIKFDDWMDIKKEAFGGPKSSVEFKQSGENGQPKNWQRTIQRNADNENGVFNKNTDGWWRAIAATTGEKPEISEHGKLVDKGKAKSSLEDFINSEKESN